MVLLALLRILSVVGIVILFVTSLFRKSGTEKEGKSDVAVSRRPSREKDS